MRLQSFDVCSSFFCRVCARFFFAPLTVVFRLHRFQRVKTLLLLRENSFQADGLLLESVDFLAQQRR